MTTPKDQTELQEKFLEEWVFDTGWSEVSKDGARNQLAELLVAGQAALIETLEGLEREFQDIPHDTGCRGCMAKVMRERLAEVIERVKDNKVPNQTPTLGGGADSK